MDRKQPASGLIRPARGGAKTTAKQDAHRVPRRIPEWSAADATTRLDDTLYRLFESEWGAAIPRRSPSCRAGHQTTSPTRGTCWPRSSTSIASMEMVLLVRVCRFAGVSARVSLHAFIERGAPTERERRPSPPRSRKCFVHPRLGPSVVSGHSPHSDTKSHKNAIIFAP